MKKKDKKKPKYSMLSDMVFMLKAAWRSGPVYFPMAAIIIVTLTLIPAIAMVLPSRVIALLEQGASFERIALEIGLMSLGLLLCAAAGQGLYSYTDFRYLTSPRLRLGCDAVLKIAATDYPHGERQDFLNASEKRLEVMNDNNSALEESFRMMQRLSTAFIGLVIYAAVLWRRCMSCTSLTTTT